MILGGVFEGFKESEIWIWDCFACANRSKQNKVSSQSFDSYPAN
jgi:hypothetical protein